MRRAFVFILILSCFAALFLMCYAPALFQDRQFGYRDAGHYYYPLNLRVQEEWNKGRWPPLWEPEENSGMPLLGNPTAAVLYPGKVVFALLPYAWAARVYIVGHSALAFVTMLVLMRSWRTSWFGSTLSALAYAFGAPILFQYCNIIYLIGAAWLPLGIHAVDRWVRLGRRWGLLELAFVLSMQTLGGDPQIAYLVGLAGIGYALGLVWNRARSARVSTAGVNAGHSSPWFRAFLAANAFVAWWVLTLLLAQWLPKFREQLPPPTPQLFWMVWVPLGINAAWGLGAIGFLIYWWKRGWRLPLGLMWVGLAASAVLAVALTAVQLFPVIEFTQRTSRAADGGPHEIYAFSVEPYRLIEVLWPNILGTQFAGNNYWADLLRMPGVRPKVWVPSLYLGGLTLVLAASTLAFRHGPPWRVWFSVIVVVSVLGSLGQYGSPIWITRALTVSTKSSLLREWLPDLGPIDEPNTNPLRKDGFFRDGDGGFYWWVSTVLPGFRQFRFPAKLFTFTTLALAALAGLGWDRVVAQRARGASAPFLVLLFVSVATLAVVLFERQAILERFSAFKSQSLFGPFDAAGAYSAIIHSLAQGSVVFGLGLGLTFLVRRSPYLAGSAALIIMTADLAAANSRFVLTVPQSLFETEPEVLSIIKAAEKADPATGPYRVHRMPIWNPIGWYDTESKDRLLELVKWERDTMQPKHGINDGVEYTHTLGVAELYDYEWYFNGFPRKVRDPVLARNLGVELEKEIVYFPRRAYDLWNTRYIVTPSWHGGWNDEMRGYAAFVFGTERIYPERDQSSDPKQAMAAEKKWIETQDFKVLRNNQAFPRAWVVHNARMTTPVTGLSRASRKEAFQEILHAGDMFWNDSTQRVYDPHSLAWVGNDDMLSLRPNLSNSPPRASEAVKVTYPSPREAVLDVTLESPGLVVLADIYYPGWQLTIDGEPARIYRANGFMRGAAASKGRHRLVYTYDPASFRVGLIVSLGGLAATLLLSLACLRWPVDRVLVSPGESLGEKTGSPPPAGTSR